MLVRLADDGYQEERSGHRTRADFCLWYAHAKRREAHTKTGRGSHTKKEGGATKCHHVVRHGTVVRLFFNCRARGGPKRQYSRQPGSLLALPCQDNRDKPLRGCNGRQFPFWSRCPCADELAVDPKSPNLIYKINSRPARLGHGVPMLD